MEPTIRRPLTIAAGLVILVALSAASFACGEVGGWGGMEDMHQDMHGGGDRVPQTPVVSTESQVIVEIRDFDFFPRELTVNVGSAITWANQDAVPHDATDEAGGWGTDILGQGEAATLTIDTPGTYPYYCTIHPNMRATLNVVERTVSPRSKTVPALLLDGGMVAWKDAGNPRLEA